MNKIKEFLETVTRFTSRNSEGFVNGKRLGFKFNNIEDFVLSEGRLMGKRSKLSDRVPRGIINECFCNAYHLSESEGFAYCEGYAHSGAFPVLHAWCLSKKGRVIDNTWLYGDEYYGVAFPRIYVIKTMLARKKYGIIDNWEKGWPLLKGESYAE